MNRLPNPSFELVMLLNKYDDKRLESDNFEMLFKNLRSNMNKVIHSSILLYDLQEDDKFIQAHDEIIKSELIEYVFYKISTTWDNAYQIASKVLPLPKVDKNYSKYDMLEDEFEQYCISGNIPTLSWYKEINKIRNRIVHGGINLITYYDNKRILFQAYDNNVDEQIPYSDFYNNGQRLTIFADYYFNYYTILLYRYLVDFFKYVTDKYTSLIPAGTVETKIDDMTYDVMKNAGLGYLTIKDLSKFDEITHKMYENKTTNEQFDFYYRQ
jgi:hypothetical protein